MAESVDDRREAFTKLYEACYWPVLRFASRRLNDGEAARDLAAETFVVAWRRWDELPRGMPLPWLYRVAGNLLANERRRLSREVAVRQRLSGPLPCADDVADHVESADNVSTVIRALYSLRRLDREVLKLHAWENLNGRDLARALGCSAATAAVRLHRARRRLEAALRSIEESSSRPSRAEPHTLNRTSLPERTQL